VPATYGSTSLIIDIRIPPEWSSQRLEPPAHIGPGMDLVLDGLGFRDSE